MENLIIEVNHNKELFNKIENHRCEKNRKTTLILSIICGTLAVIMNIINIFSETADNQAAGIGYTIFFVIFFITFLRFSKSATARRIDKNIELYPKKSVYTFSDDKFTAETYFQSVNSKHEFEYSSISEVHRIDRTTIYILTKFNTYCMIESERCDEIQAFLAQKIPGYCFRIIPQSQQKIVSTQPTNKSNVVPIIILIAIIALAFVSSIILHIKYDYLLKNDLYIFENISDLSFLDEYIIKDDIPDKADNYTQRKCVDVKYNGKTYSVYAYTFKTNEAAFKYASKKSKSDYNALYEQTGETDFYFGKTTSLFGLFNNRKTLLVSKNNVLILEGKTGAKDYSDFLGFVFEKLPQKIENKFWKIQKTETSKSLSFVFILQSL